MENKQQDQLLKELAQKYADQYGYRLRQEMEQLEKENVTYLTPRLDQQVKNLLSPRKNNKRYIRMFAAIAACLVFAFILPFTGQFLSQNSGESAAPMPSETAQSQQEQPEPPPVSEKPQYEAIPLQFTLPNNFSVSAVEQDIEKTIYYLADAYQDPVIMTLKNQDTGLETAGLQRLFIGNAAVYGYSCADYHLLTFEKDGLVYEMTCRYDMNTLVKLGEGILV